MHTLLKSQCEETAATSSATERQSSLAPGGRGLSARLRQKLLYMHISSFDWKHGGLQAPLKFLDRDSIEYSLCQAARHDKNEERMARLSLANGMALLDRDRGGIYQFATSKCWQNSCYSKSIAAQAGSLRLYSLAYALLRDHDFLLSARNIVRYTGECLLIDEGVFRSLPADTIINFEDYARSGDSASGTYSSKENGWLCEALACYYEFTGGEHALEMAVRALDCLLAQRRCPAGGIREGDSRRAGACLAANLAVARACLQLYRVTGTSRYLQLSDEIAAFICERFANPAGGFNAWPAGGPGRPAAPQIDENICLGRFLNLLHYYTDKDEYLEQAVHALRYLAVPQVATSRMEEAGILLLDEELSRTPMKIRILADRHERATAALVRNAWRTFGWYKVLHLQQA